jgi:hypothetical protein
VSCYMLELYQDDLADLLLPQSMIDGQVKARPSCFFSLLIFYIFTSQHVCTPWVPHVSQAKAR